MSTTSARVGRSDLEPHKEELFFVRREPPADSAPRPSAWKLAGRGDLLRE